MSEHISTQDDAMPLQPTTERVLSPQEKTEIFRAAIEGGINTALQMIAERFEQAPDKKNNLAFHNTHHTGDVIRRFDAVINAIRAVDPSLIDDRSHAMGRFAAAHHDTVQNWEPIEAPSKTPGEEGLVAVMRKRFGGANEAASTAGALAIMDKINEEAGTEIFTKEDRAIVSSGHEATVPDFTPEKGVFQKNLNDHSSVITRAIALADLGTAGIDGPEKFLPEGDAVFREENLDIAEAVEHPESLSSQQKEFFRRRMLGWSEFQEKFAKKRKMLLEEELRPLPPLVRDKLKKDIFDKFDQSITEAGIRVTGAEGVKGRMAMSFEELVKAMGYKLGNDEKVVY